METMTTRRPGRPAKAADAPPSADQLKRLQFIERSAYWAGGVGRRAVATAFKVSLGHASQDFARYRRMAPRNLEYVPEDGCYRPTAGFRPQFAEHPPETLLEMLAVSVDWPVDERLRWLGFDAPTMAVGPLSSRVDAPTTALLFRAVASGKSLGFIYQSLQDPEPSARRLQPTGFIHTGRRWLLRGWDPDRQGFRDFALSRISKARERAALATPEDKLWSETSQLLIEPAEGLSPSQADVVAWEHGMSKSEDGIWQFRSNIRRVLIPYTLDFLSLRPGATRQGDVPNVRLMNYPDLEPYDRRSAYQT